MLAAPTVAHRNRTKYRGQNSTEGFWEPRNQLLTMTADTDFGQAASAACGGTPRMAPGTSCCAARESRATMDGPMKTNVTLKLDADLLREARVVAAEEGRSISALLTDRLEAIVRERKAFDKARRRALTRLREGLDLQWTPPKSRDELHER